MQFLNFSHCQADPGQAVQPGQVGPGQAGQPSLAMHGQSDQAKQLLATVPLVNHSKQHFLFLIGSGGSKAAKIAFLLQHIFFCF